MLCDYSTTCDIVPGLICSPNAAEKSKMCKKHIIGRSSISGMRNSLSPLFVAVLLATISFGSTFAEFVPNNVVEVTSATKLNQLELGNEGTAEGNFAMKKFRSNLRQRQQR